MKKLFLLLSVCFVFSYTQAHKDSIKSKIISGQDVITHIPWMAGIFISYSNTACNHNEECFDRFEFKCAASLIHESWLVTAAHCIQVNSNIIDPRAFNIYMGGLSLDEADELLQVDQVIVHEQYNAENGFKNDIALIKLSQPVSHTPLEIILPGKEALITSGREMLLMGWGRDIQNGFYIYPDQLQMTQLNFVDFEVCQEIFSSLTVLESNQMCAGGDGVHDACDGDSGGPLIVNIAGRWKLVGLVSFGVPTCALTGYPTVFTRLSEYKQWIASNNVPSNPSTMGELSGILLLFMIVMALMRKNVF